MGMRGSGVRRSRLLTEWLPIMLWVIASSGCAAPTSPLEMTALDPAQDHWRIATAYAREATAMRQRAEELSKRASHYERLFGADSEWVTGTKLLAHFYEDAAREQQRLAEVHVGLASGHGTLPPPRLDSR